MKLAVTCENWSPGFTTSLTQTNLYSLGKRLEACTFGCKKEKDGTIHVAKTKGLISFAVTTQLIRDFVVATQIVRFLFFLNQKF